MCGIVRNPTRREDFPKEKYPNIPSGSVEAIAIACQDVHIPHIATALVLGFANEMTLHQDFVIQSIPFAVYQGGKRFVSPESAEMEQAIMHLAMAGSVRRIINHELRKLGLVLELGHCCDIQLWELVKEEEAMSLSHDGNVWRADKLRSLTAKDQRVVTGPQFIRMAGKPHGLTEMMHHIVASKLLSAH